MKLQYAIVARRAIISQDNNCVTLVDIIEELATAPLAQAQEDALLQVELAFVVLFDTPTPKELSVGDMPGKFWISTPTGTKVETPLRVNFDKRPRFRSIVNCPAIPYVGFGPYTFHFECNEIVGEWTVHLVAAPSPPEATLEPK